MSGVGWKKLITEERITADFFKPVGWYTIAVSLVSINASARFGLNNVFAEGIGNVTFYATTTSTSESQINIISKSGKGPFPIENIRIKIDPDGTGAALQFYNNSEDNRFSLILFGDNEGNGVGNWELIDFLPDNDNPGEDYNLTNTQWSNFNVATIIDANTVNLGLSTTGTLLSKELKIGEYLKLPLNDLDDTTTDTYVTFNPPISFDRPDTPGNVFNSNLINQDICFLSTVTNATVDYDIESKLGSPQIITQFKIYFSAYAGSCRKVKILGSNDGSTFVQIFEEPEATVPSDTAAMVIRTVPFTNTTAYSHYRLEILKDFCATPNDSFGVNLIEIEYFTGFSSLIKDSKLTTDSIVLSTNTTGTTSDDIVVRDNLGNLKTVSVDTISNLVNTNDDLTSDGPDEGTLVSLYSHIATNAQLMDVNEDSNSLDYPIVFSSLTDGFSSMLVNSNITINPSTNTITSTNFTGNLEGTATLADNAALLDGLNSSLFLRSNQSDTTTGQLTVKNDDGVFIKSATNANGAKIFFSDKVGSYAQQGTLQYKHSDGAVTTLGGNSNDGWIFSGTEARTVVKVEGDIVAENIYSNNNLVLTTASTITSTNANNINSINAPDGNFRVALIGEEAGYTPLNIDSNLNWDSTNNRLGIGTNSPTERLHVEGDIFSSADIYANSIVVATNIQHTNDSNTKFAFTTDSFQCYAGGIQMLTGTDELVVNEGGVDMNFRVESNNNANLLFVDGGNDRIGINTNTPGCRLELKGTLGSFKALDAGNEIQLTRNSFNYITAGAYYGSGNVNNTSGKLVLRTVDSSGVAHQAMSIDNDGTIDITKNNPTTTLLTVTANGDTTSGVPTVIFKHSEGTVDNNDTILELDFDDDQTIVSSNHYIRFQNQDGVVGSINSEVAYSTFTGAHISQKPSGSSFINWKPGMIVKSTGEIINRGNYETGSLSMAWPIVDITSTQKDKAVMGVFTSLTPAPTDHELYTTDSKNVGRISGLNDNAPSINYNALGEGRILVTDTNGDIEVGDYICTSTRLGHGEKQDDDLMHNYTVAKATQPCSFTSASIDSDLGFKSMLIACTYHCG